MQGKKIIITMVLCGMMLAGWLSAARDRAAKAKAYKENITQADEWVEEGLYQRAIKKYQEAIAYRDTAENWRKLIGAYEKRMMEDEGIIYDYEEALTAAAEHCPSEAEFYKKLIDYYCEQKEYQNAYKWLCNAKEAELWDEYLETRYFEVAYRYELKGHEYKEFAGEANGAYSVTNGYEWQRIGTDGDEVEEAVYEYVNLAGKEGVKLVTLKNDSRLINKEGMVLGIFPQKCEAAGVYAEGRIPVKDQGEYAYYDEFAVKQFGGYEQAGTFYDGSAAVCSNGTWEIIEADGKKTGDAFADIRLDREGCYNKQTIILAAKQPGEYHLYEKDWKQIGDFTCEDIDICTGDGIIACQIGGQWGYVDVKGNILIEPQYEAAKSFSNGLAAVCIDGTWGFIDCNNRLVIENVFLDADYFNEAGCCMVSTLTEREVEINDETGEKEQVKEQIWELLELKVKR